MQKHPEFTRDRIEKYVEEVIRPLIWREALPLTASVYRPEGAPRDFRAMHIDPDAASRADYAPVAVGYAWGPVWSDAWFRFEGRVPAEWRGKRVAALIDVGAEAIVWDGDDPLQGIDGNHDFFTVASSADGGEEIALTVQATGINQNVSVHGRPQPPGTTPYTFRRADLAFRDDAMYALYHDLRIAYGVMMEQPDDSPRFGQLLYALNAAVNLLEEQGLGCADEARDLVAKTFNRPAVPSAHRVSAIGNSHIDSAWLWPAERTQYKCIHTFSTAVRCMDEYPEYRFLCSQAAQYEWVKRMAPKLYERIREKIRAGQWEVAGSMWVEADCNLSSGESLVRQILHGKNFFMDEFGVETVDLWLPDVFGYSAALPQILKKAGVEQFLTQKISWNQFNKLPHHTFLWQGIDGSRIFTHFPPADTYAASMLPKELARSVRNFREHDRSDRSLFAFGHGDGGGGPTTEMLEGARRLANVEGMPTVTIEKAADFFRKAKAEAKDLPVWTGELYFERHRGTYTTQARTKRANRKSEVALRDAEFLSVVHPAGLSAYPLAELDSAWKTTLFNQFHDIIPGSSIAEVYEDSARDYAEVEHATRRIIDTGLAALAEAIDTRSIRRPVLVVSNLSHFATEAVEVPLRSDEAPVAAFGPEGDISAVQILEGEKGRSALFVARNVPLHGYTVWDLEATSVPPDDDDRVLAGDSFLENGCLRVEFDPDTGLIARIFDKVCERDVLNDPYERNENGDPVAFMPDRAGNQLQALVDRPVFWDAWDVDISAFETARVVTGLDSMEVVENGPVRGAIRVKRTLPGGASTITQTIRLISGSPRIDFVTEVDWHESDVMLKAAFPVAVNSSRASYEIQFGHAERPTHTNTSWEMARFEVCAQRWADLSEGDYGVAILNDCKYGHDIHENVMRLSLLRSTKAPDPEADMGRHVFTYSLLPHVGDLREGEVVETASALNAPLIARAITGNKPGRLPALRSFFELDNAGVFIEAIKRAEKEEAIVVRLYEAHNTRGTVTLTTGLNVKRAYICDLLERNLVEIPVSGREMLLPIHPFEIVTVKLVL